MRYSLVTLSYRLLLGCTDDHCRSFAMIAESSSSSITSSTRLLLLLLASSAIWLQPPMVSGAAATYTKSDCYFPFLYNGKEYSYCTRNSYHVLWCSLDKVYNGRWAPCDPEVPKAVMEKLAAAVEEVGKEKAMLAAEEKAIDGVVKSVRQLAAVNAKAHLNKSAAIDALDKKLDSLNSTIKQLELHQKNLDRRESNQESLRPLEIGTMLLLTVAVAIMSALLCALHCCPGKGGCGRFCCDSGFQRDPQLGASVPQTPQLSCLGLRPVQPGTLAAADDADAAPPGTSSAEAKKFPGHFYHLTVDEEDEEEAGEDDDEEEDDEDNGEDGSSEQHSRAAAALASAVSDRDRDDGASGAAGAAGSPTAAAAATAPASGRRGFLRR